MKKNLFRMIISITLVLVFLTSCELPTQTNQYKGTEYNITYLYENISQQLTPNTYIAGEALTLPTLDKEGFVGWFTTPSCQGEPIKTIDALAYGDKTFYALVTDEPIVKTEYKITYFYQNKEQALTPSKYEKGTSLTLPTLNVEGFIGWYLSADFIGQAVTKIEATDLGDKVFYALVKQNSDPTPDLAKALNSLTNFHYLYTYSCTDGTDDYEAMYDYQPNLLKATYEIDSVSYVDYVEYNVEEDMFYYYAQQDDGTYIRYNELSETFASFMLYIDMIYLDEFDVNDFTYKDGYFELTDLEKVNEIGKNTIGDFVDETYSSIKIKVENDVITHVLASSKYFYEEEYFDYNYDIILSNHGNVSFTLPEATDEEPIDDFITISEIYQQVDNTTIMTAGYVSGIIGNNVYICDETGGVYIYFGFNNIDLEKMVVGSYLIIAGTKTTFNGLVEIVDITDCEVDDTELVEIKSTTLTSLSNDELNKYMSCPISFTKATFVRSSTWNDSKDNSLKITDGNNEITLFISKYLSNSQKATLKAFVENLKAGDTFKINDAIVSCYNTNQITLIESSTLTKGYQEGDDIVPVELVANNSSLRVEIDTTWEEILNKLSFKVINNDDSELDVTSLVSYKQEYDGSKIGSYKVEVTYLTLSIDLTIVVIDQASLPFTPTDVDTIVDVAKTMGVEGDEVYGVNRGLPATGNAKVLVLPVDFTDYKAKDNTVTNLEKVLFGTSEETGWESLTSYYYKASYGKLNIQGSVLPVYHTNKASTYYDSQEDGDYEILKAALMYYDNTVDYSEYDSDNDTYIDAIIMVYSCPISEEDDSMYWAYTYEYYTDDYEYYDGVEADFFSFIGYDFIEETPASSKKINYNAETFIHETGHLLGLDDYYDTDETAGPAGGIGGATMMDYNNGDLDAFSKTILGWITPQVCNNQDATVTLKSFGETGDAIIIPKAWNGTFFDEYFIITFYTPDGLNRLEQGYNGLFSIEGICIYHIDATLQDPTNVWTIWELYQYNNSTTSHKLISLVEADGGNDIEGTDEYGGWSSDTDLFLVNDVFDNATWYDGTKADFIVEVLSIENGEAEILIDYQSVNK